MAKGKTKKSSLEARAKAAMKEWLNPSNPALEQALFEAITDDTRWLVYADWLQQIGDVRGEIIALGLAGKTDEAKERAAASEEFLWAGARDLEEKLEKQTWTGGWEGAEPQPLEVTFKPTLGTHGMIDTVEIRGLDEDGHVASAATALFSAPIARFVRTLRLDSSLDGSYSGASGQPDLGLVISAIAKTKPVALHELVIGTGGYQISWTVTGAVGVLLATTPYLEYLAIKQGSIDLGDSLDLPKLRTLRLETGGLDRENLHAIANAKWPSLETLVVFFGEQDRGCNATRDDVAKLLANPFPKLRELALCNAEIPCDIASEIVRSPLLSQLESIDLSKGTLVDEEVQVIFDHAALFQDRRLDVSANYLSPSCVGKLKEMFAERVTTEPQRYEDLQRDGAEYRFTEVGE